MKRFVSSIILVLFFGLFSFFVFRFNHTYLAAFYFSYFFLLFAVLLGIFWNFFRVFSKKERSPLIPIHIATFIYIGIETLLAVIFIPIGTISILVNTCIQVPLFFIYIAAIAVLYLASSHVSGNVKQIQQDAIVRNNLSDQISLIGTRTKDIALKDEIESVANQRHYSQISHKTSLYDQQIQLLILQLQNAVVENKNDNAIRILGSLKTMIQSRSQHS